MKEVHIWGGDICSCLEKLWKTADECGEECRCEFNSSYLLSTDTIDDAYLRIVGVTKAEHDEYRRKKAEEYKREQEEFKAKIPQMSEEYRKMARGLVIDSELDFWDEIVPIRLGDLYRGMELDCTLNICRVMRDEDIDFDARIRKGYDMFKEQGHSGMSAGLTMWMLRKFCPNGNELADAIKEFRFENE